MIIRQEFINFLHFPFLFFFKNLSVTNWQLLLKFQLPNIFFSCHGNQNGCNLELCKDPLWVWVGPLQVNQVVFLARHFTPCCLLIQSFQSQCIRMVFLIFLKFFSFCHFVIMIHPWKLKRNYILGWLRLNYQLLFRNMSPYWHKRVAKSNLSCSLRKLFHHHQHFMSTNGLSQLDKFW